MPSVMLRRGEKGISFYVAKKDLEETVVAIEFESPEKWGGEIKLADGSLFYIEPIPEPKMPITLKAKRR